MVAGCYSHIGLKVILQFFRLFSLFVSIFHGCFMVSSWACMVFPWVAGPQVRKFIVFLGIIPRIELFNRVGGSGV